MKKWLRRAVAFLKTLAEKNPDEVTFDNFKKPLAKTAINGYIKNAGCAIPNSLKEFYSTATSQCGIGYYIEDQDLMGNICFQPVSEIKSGLRVCKMWGKGIAEHNPKAGAVWLGAFPFIDIGDGDIIACDMRKALDDPPVVYLNHEGIYVRPIANSFTAFLYHWERICYVGPEYWRIEDFIDKRTGLLNSDKQSARKLRKKFRLEFGVTLQD